MATQLEKDTSIIISRSERTWRATIETPRGKPYSVDVHREVVTTDATGALVGEPVRAADYNFRFDDVKDTKVTLGGTTMTIGQIAAFSQAGFDQLVAAKKQADIDSAKAAEDAAAKAAEEDVKKKE